VWAELRHFLRISRGRRGRLWEALVALAIARVAMAILPFRRIAAWLGTPGTESPATATAEDIRVAKEIGWAVDVLGRRVPWDGRCLARALAATGMLRRRGLEGTVIFGARWSESSCLDAHAWLRLGSLIVTGEPSHEGFKTFTTFARRQS
jgi:hypothetical protein